MNKKHEGQEERIAALESLVEELQSRGTILTRSTHSLTRTYDHRAEEQWFSLASPLIVDGARRGDHSLQRLLTASSGEQATVTHGARALHSDRERCVGSPRPPLSA